MTLPLPRSVRFSRSSRRHAYTLLELMLVLAVLTVIIAIVWPSLRKPLHRSAVEQAAGQLVKDLGQARLAAIERGQIVRFRYEPGGTRYLLEAAASPSDDRDSTDGTAADELPATDTRDEGSLLIATDNELSVGGEADAGDRGQRDELPPWKVLGTLPDEVVFRDPAEFSDAELPPGSALADNLAAEASEREEVKPLIDRNDEESDLSSPVYFYPNGRADNAELMLVGPEEYRMAVRVRGLTGAASLGPLEHPVRDYSDRARPNRQDATREERNQKDFQRESPRNGGADGGFSERAPSAAPRRERSTPAEPARTTRERE